MTLILLFRNVLNVISEFWLSLIRRSKLQRRYPTCHFYPGVYVDNISSLGRLNVLFKNSTIINSVIGDHSFVQEDSRIIYADVGKFCSIASRVSIGLGRHPASYVSSHSVFYSSSQPIAKTFSHSDTFTFFKRTYIGHDVWIGENAMIKDGIKIGTGAIIGAGAVVTKDVPDYAIVGGVPAEIIRYRFDETVRRELIETKWWDMSDEWLQKHYLLFSEPVKFLELWKSHKNRLNGAF